MYDVCMNVCMCVYVCVYELYMKQGKKEKRKIEPLVPDSPALNLKGFWIGPPSMSLAYSDSTIRGSLMYVKH